jgi:hypothetical protein
MKNTTVKIDAVRRETLKDAVFEISMETRKMITMSDVIKHLIDHHTGDAIKEMTSAQAQKKCE